MSEKIKKPGRARILQIGIVLGVVLFIMAAVIVPPLFSKKTAVKKGATAFGKLPAPAASARAAMEARPAIGMPVGGDGFWGPVFEYVWAGGDWPTLADKMPVYRRAPGKISLAQAKDIAAKFGLTGEPEPDEPARLLDKGVPAPGGAPTQVAPAPDGQSEPPNPGNPGQTPAEPPVTAPDAPEPRPVPEPAPFKSYRFYEQSSGKRLEIIEGDGRFSYMVEGAWQAVEKNAGARPSESEAKNDAIAFLKEKELLPDGYTGPFIAETGVVSSAVVNPDGADVPFEEPKVIEPPYAEVQFGKKLGGLDVVEPSGEPSRYIASVTVGPGGTIMAASGEMPSALEESDYPLMTLAAAFEEVKKGKLDGIRALGAPAPMLSAPVQSEPGVVSGDTGTVEPGQPPGEPPNPVPPVKPEPIKVELNKVELAYILVMGADGVGYYQPAYVFSGKMNGTDQTKYSVAVPAVDAKYID